MKQTKSDTDTDLLSLFDTNKLVHQYEMLKLWLLCYIAPPAKENAIIKALTFKIAKNVCGKRKDKIAIIAEALKKGMEKLKDVDPDMMLLQLKKLIQYHANAQFKTYADAADDVLYELKTTLELKEKDEKVMSFIEASLVDKENKADEGKVISHITTERSAHELSEEAEEILKKYSKLKPIMDWAERKDKKANEKSPFNFKEFIRHVVTSTSFWGLILSTLVATFVINDVNPAKSVLEEMVTNIIDTFGINGAFAFYVLCNVGMFASAGTMIYWGFKDKTEKITMEYQEKQQKSGKSLRKEFDSLFKIELEVLQQDRNEFGQEKEEVIAIYLAPKLSKEENRETENSEKEDSVKNPYNNARLSVTQSNFRTIGVRPASKQEILKEHPKTEIKNTKEYTESKQWEIQKKINKDQKQQQPTDIEISFGNGRLKAMLNPKDGTVKRADNGQVINWASKETGLLFYLAAKTVARDIPRNEENFEKNLKKFVANPHTCGPFGEHGLKTLNPLFPKYGEVEWQVDNQSVKTSEHYTRAVKLDKINRVFTIDLALDNPNDVPHEYRNMKVAYGCNYSKALAGNSGNSMKQFHRGANRNKHKQKGIDPVTVIADFDRAFCQSLQQQAAEQPKQNTVGR